MFKKAARKILMKLTNCLVKIMDTSHKFITKISVIGDNEFGVTNLGCSSNLVIVADVNFRAEYFW